jgi:CRISPR/Cas system CSM-associated protein Csm2 small subunit
MKKILLLIISLLISFSFVNYTNAISLDHKLYREVTITNIQIEKDYWKEVKEKIVTIFKKYRYEKNIETLSKLKKVLKDKIQTLNNKSILSRTERKTLNLYNNLYYRTILLLDYNLK